ncbi:MAG: GPR endopeptidase [Oscillospiraceae bacterium]|nr:GPR endopeptidase [Oscillospiraceae bacterium]
MRQRRTDLALEAHELWADHSGVTARERDAFGYGVSVVEVDTPAAARSLGKPMGAYVTLDLRPYWQHAEDALERAATAVGAELRALLPEVKTALVVGLGNNAMTPDAIGPQVAEHVLVTRHLMRDDAFAALTAVSVLVPGVLGRTGMEAAETIRGAVRTVRPDALIAVDALASRSLDRVCTTVQLTDTGIVPGSGVGNRRRALNRATLGIPVIAVGVPTVVDVATLALDILEEAGAADLDPAALRGHDGVMVTPRDIDAQIRELSRVVGYGIDLALQPLSYAELCALMG